MIFVLLDFQGTVFLFLVQVNFESAFKSLCLWGTAIGSIVLAPIYKVGLWSVFYFWMVWTRPFFFFLPHSFWKWIFYWLFIDEDETG